MSGSDRHERHTAEVRGGAVRRTGSRRPPAPRRPRLDYPRRGRRGLRRWLPSWRQLLLLTLLGLGGLTGLVGYAYANTRIPTDLNAFATQQNNVYFWADGTEMARTGLVNRQEVPLSQVPDGVQWATLAAENETFYTDAGVSPRGIARAVWTMATGGQTEGGSTITQQYVKNAYLTQKQTLTRKFTEILIAVKLDRAKSKSDILDDYLNTSWYGRGAYGIERAAQAYYGVDASQLNPSQGAFLASLLKGAGLYDPSISPANHARAVTRWQWILDRMVKIGKLTPAERAQYTTFPEPRATPEPASLQGQTGYLVDTARTYLAAHSDISDTAFDLGGYQIHTTFEKPKETALTAAVQDAATRQPGSDQLRVGAASVATDGRILALYGGPDYLKQGYDNANSGSIQVGSAFAPIVYAAGLGQGAQHGPDGVRRPVTPDTLYDGDDQLAMQTAEGPYFDRDGRIVKAANDGGRSYGSIPLRTAIEQSVNSPLEQLGLDVGLGGVQRTATDLGLLSDSLGPQVPAFSVGNSTPSAIRMADAYGAFADGGVHQEPYSISSVTRDGRPVPLQRTSPIQALSPQVAGQVDAALQDAVQHGTARAAQLPGRTVAGKTGTTTDDKAGWFIGYSGQLSTAVVVFRMDLSTLAPQPLDGPDPTRTTAATGYPIDVWNGYMKAVPAGG
ncbi:transglycosylase domain-containing protein [Kitasatospora sp. NPDC052896]|uniref:transglycosylase domain-containing protein n=1 Tax=Kitasatospora sp. NPDC052896 TaxID=3364061 RepID=UPI0037C753DC